MNQTTEVGHPKHQIFQVLLLPLDKPLGGLDGRVEQRPHPVIVIYHVRIADAHEQHIGGQTWQKSHGKSRLQLIDQLADDLGLVLTLPLEHAQILTGVL